MNDKKLYLYYILLCIVGNAIFAGVLIPKNNPVGFLNLITVILCCFAAVKIYGKKD